MRKIFSITLFLTLAMLSGRIMAQGCPNGGGAHGGHHGNHMEMMKTALGLSDAQMKQMAAIDEKFSTQKQAIWADTKLDEQAKHAKMKALRETQHAEMQAVLTPDQQAKAAEMFAAHGAGGHGSGSGMKGQGGHHGMGMHDGHGKVWKQLEPIVIAQRVKFEAELSATDKAEIAVLRGQLEALRPQMQAGHQAMHQAKEQGQAPTEEQRAAMKELHTQKRAIFDQAMVIGKRYETQLEALHDEVAPQIEAIMKEAQAQHMGNQSGDCAKQCTKGKGDCKGKMQGHGEGHGGAHGEFHHGPMGAHDGEDHHDRMLAHFILMDPNAPALPSTPKGGTATKSGAANGAEASGNELTVFPNPATGKNTLRYSVAQTGQVRVELMTIDGKLIKVVHDGKQSAGTQSLEVNIAELAPGTYLYRLIDAAGSRTMRFTVAQ